MTEDRITEASRSRLDGLARVAAGLHDDPFSVLGPHDVGGQPSITVFVPDARTVTALLPEHGEHDLPAHQEVAGIFSGPVPDTGAYRLRATTGDGASWEFDDAYRFGPVPGQAEPFSGDARHRLWQVLGAHVREHDGATGTRFAVWAPNARRVSVVGGFNNWDGRRHPMRRHASGIWELFVPGIGAGESYKYELLGPDGALLPLKADPVGFGSEHPPLNASVVREMGGHDWQDGDWMAGRAARNDTAAPISIYEVHLGSWRRKGDRPISYREAAEELVGHATDLGFTHIELMPLAEHPFDGSWGYQPVGLFAPTIRHGTPDELRELVDAAHRAGLGVILDWVPGHFPTDDHGLGRFDGTALYEYADPKEGFHPEWNTLIYDYGRSEVRDFLVSNALYWLEDYHVDGLRVDAVASMLHRDFSREPGEWVPNADGGRENLEAIAMLREMNAATRDGHPGTITVAEESAAFPLVTAPEADGGLGFGYKWNMGWGFDALDYIRRDPAERQEHHHKLTFGLTYAFDEAFVLPISHDEVVHGRGSLLAKMPGERDAQFANLCAFFGFMWGHPGKKLLFMGQEFGQAAEWSHEDEVDWAALEDPRHAGVQRLVRDLNALYRGQPALHARDADPAGFQWIEADDTANSVYAWIRKAGPGAPDVVVICNFGTTDHPGYRVGLPSAGPWDVALNTDAGSYGGAGRGVTGMIEVAPEPRHGQPASAEIRLPALSAVFLVGRT